MLETYKFTFDVSEFNYARNYTLDKNGKTTLPQTKNARKLRSTGHVIITD